jgi:hypothetical protein
MRKASHILISYEGTQVPNKKRKKERKKKQKVKQKVCWFKHKQILLAS